jgi:hypothetical protein
MVDKKALVKKYCKFVDQNEINKLLDLFSKRIVYFRCERKIEGLDELKNFYLKKRKIAGKHVLGTVLENNSMIVVNGSFIGKNSKENILNLDFVDIFYFDKDLKIEKRLTYLRKGASEIE